MSRSLARIGLLLGMAALLSVLVYWFHPQREAVSQGILPSLAVAQALSMHPLWVDARSQEEFIQGHIPGAVPLNDRNWEDGFSRLSSMVQPSTILVVYCGSQSCHSSREAAIRLKRELGLKSVYTLSGGFEAWQAAQNKS